MLSEKIKDWLEKKALELLQKINRLPVVWVDHDNCVGTSSDYIIYLDFSDLEGGSCPNCGADIDEADDEICPECDVDYTALDKEFVRQVRQSSI